jgi:hypothetical protein
MDEPHWTWMEVSSTYRAIMRQGFVEGARRILVLQGETKFGPPDAAARATIENTSDLAQLEDWAVRLVTSAGSWKELLTPPELRRRPRGRGAWGRATAQPPDRRPVGLPCLAARRAPRYAAGGGSRQSG